MKPRLADEPTPVSPKVPFSSGVLLFLLVLAALEWRAMPAARANLIEEDGAYWASFAAALARGDWSHGLSTAWPPGYPALIAVLAWMTRAASSPAMLEGCARVVSVFAGALLLIPLYRLARRLLPEAGARAVAALAAFHPRLTSYSAAALSEMTYTFLLLLGLAALADAEDPRDAARRHRRQALAGAALGASYLVRPEGLLLAAGLWTVGLARGGGSMVARLRPAFLIGLAVVALPYLALVHARLGTWSLGEKGAYNFWRAWRVEYAQLYPAPRNLAARVNQSPELSAGLAPERVEILGLVLRRPGRFAQQTLARLARIVFDTVPTTLYWPFALVALLGFAGPRAGPWWLVATPLALAPLLYAPFSTDRRFLVPLVPLLLIACGQGLSWLDSRGPRGAAPAERAPEPSRAAPGPEAARGSRLGRLGRVMAVALLAYSLVWGLWLLREQHPAREHRAMGEWLRRAWVDPGQRSSLLGLEPEPPSPYPPASVGGSARPIVAARKPWVAFYSGGLIAELPDSLPGTLARLARVHAAVFVVADARAASSDRPALAPRLDPGQAPPGLIPVRVLDRPARIVLYRVAADSAAR